MSKLANQKNFKTLEECMGAVKSAKTLKELNEMRLSVVKLATPDNGLLELWQERYWAFKKCPECAKRKFKN